MDEEDPNTPDAPATETPVPEAPADNNPYIPDEVEQVTDFVKEMTDKLIEMTPSLIGAALILIFGWIVSRSLGRLISRICKKREIDVTLTKFLASCVKLVIFVFFLVIAINKIGVEMAPFIALIGASAFGLSLAVQGPVSNYGAGIVLIITRPFKVDDTLTVHDRTGLVGAIKLGYTQLITEDGEQVTIPNRRVLGEILTNSFHFMVVEDVVGIEYSADPEVAIAAIYEVIQKVEGIADDKTPQVGIQSFGDSSIDIGYRYWVKTHNYYSIKYAVNLEVFKALKAAGVGIPFPQREVRLLGKEDG